MVLITFIWGIFKEAFAKKIILAIFAFFSLLIILLILGITNSSVEGLQMMLETGGGGLKDAVIMFQTFIISKIPMFMLLTAFIIITSSFIPEMLKKGYIDLLISKPISRTKIIIGHFISGILLVFLCLLFLLAIIWLIISLKSGIWNFPFLYSVLWFTFIFAVFYSSIILFGLLTRSTVLTLLINMIILFPITWLLQLGVNYFETDKQNVVFGSTSQFIIKFFYFILPKAWALQDVCETTIKSSGYYDVTAVLSSFMFMIVMLAISVWYFNKKDF